MSTRNSEKPQGRERAKGAGGTALYERYGAEHMRQMGARGLATIREKYGLRFYSEIARRHRGRKHPRKNPSAS